MDAIEQAKEALRALLDRYTSLVNCGDCGNWNPEMDAEVIAARAALASLEHMSEARNARGVEGGRIEFTTPKDWVDLDVLTDLLGADEISDADLDAWRGKRVALVRIE